jgi:protein gp37
MPKQPSRIFVCDMNDLFGPFIAAEWIDRILEVVAQHPQHTYQVLTKRAPRMRKYFARRGGPVIPNLNLWLGTSIEQRRHLNRLKSLYSIPAVIRFAS